jgi:hypothetical protein
MELNLGVNGWSDAGLLRLNRRAAHGLAGKLHGNKKTPWRARVRSPPEGAVVEAGRPKIAAGSRGRASWTIPGLQSA